MNIEKREVTVYTVNGHDFNSMELALAYVQKEEAAERKREHARSKQRYLRWMDHQLNELGLTWNRSDCYDFMSEKFVEVAEWFGYRVEKI